MTVAQYRSGLRHTIEVRVIVEQWALANQTAAQCYDAVSLPRYYHGSEVVVTWYYHDIVW